MTSNDNKIVLTLTCPFCGGQIQTVEGEDMVICNYCDSIFTLTSDEGIGRVMYKLAITREEAIAKYKEWLKKGPKAKDLSGKASISEAFPIYLPFWRVRGRGKACVCGIEKRTESDGKHTYTKSIPREALINREFVYTKIACEPGDLGVETLRIPSNAEAVLFEDENIETFQVTKARGTAYEDGIAAIKKEAIDIGGARMTEVKFARSFFFPTGFHLIYYPVWIIRYKYEDRDYLTVVDGISCKILSGRAPGNAGSQSTAAAIGGTVSGALIASGTVTAPLVLTLEGDVLFLALAVVCIPIAVAVFILIKCFKRFRYGGEISEGAVKGKSLKVGRETKETQTVPGSDFDWFN